MRDFGVDPQRALQFVKQSVAEAPAQLADGLGRLMREAPPERVEQVMRSPARKPIDLRTLLGKTSVVRPPPGAKSSSSP